MLSFTLLTACGPSQPTASPKPTPVAMRPDAGARDGSTREPQGTETARAGQAAEPAHAGGAAPSEDDAGAAEPKDAGGSDAADPRDAGKASQEPCKPFVMPEDCTVPEGAVLPAELRCTGLYADADAKRLACGVEPYAPAFELWSDGAHKQRYISLPEGTHVDVTDPDHFVFPVGTQLWKEFHVEREGQRRLAETRLLRKSEQGWLYTTYVWSEDGSRAEQQNDGVSDWFGSGHSVPNRDQCRGCHEGRPDFVLGWDMLMLGEGASGLTRSELARRGLLHDANGRVAADSALLESKVPGDRAAHDALGYLHANCGVSCHNETSLAAARDTGLFLHLPLARLTSPTAAPAAESGINRLPGPQAKLPPGGPYYDIRPGDPEHSLLLARMRVRGIEAQMPRLGTNRVDERGVELVTRWIEAMTEGSGYPAAQPTEGGVTPQPELDAGTPIDAGEPEPMPEPDAAVPPGCQAESAPDTHGLAYEVVVRDARISVATFAAQAPGSDDWFIVDMIGAIWQVHDGAVAPEPFLDLRDAVQLGAGFDQTTLTYDERGLVGLAFAPDYQTSGLFYVTLTPSRANAHGLEVDHDLVLEFQRTAVGPPALTRRLVDLTSAAALLGNIHNMNTLRFGPDGYLYVGSGDGGGIGCNDAERGAAQDIGRAYGKILRLDPLAPPPYAAADNPFTWTGDPRVFHYGVRNPFRFSFDRQTGDLYLGDVGQDTYEELDYAPAGSTGLNFGWPRYEANAGCPGSTTALAGPAPHTSPIFVAHRSARATGPFSDYRAITGGVVYRGAALPALQGVYLFGDYYGRRLGALYQCGAQTSPVSVLAKACDPNNPSEACLPTPASTARFNSLTAIVEDHAGELYFVANGNSLLKLLPRP